MQHREQAVEQPVPDRRHVGAGQDRDDARLEQYKEWASKTAPLGRIGLPADIAWAILYLASDASCFMTGQILRPNGGIAMPW